MVEYRLVVKLHEGHFEVWREKMDDHGHVTASSIYNSEYREKLPYSNMEKVLKSIASVFREMGMNVNKPDVKKLFIRDTFQLYHEDLSEPSELEEIHKLIPKPVIFDTVWDRWRKLDSQQQQQILKKFHAYYEEIDAKFNKRKTLLLAPPPPSERTLDREEAKQLVEEAASKSVDTAHFRKAIMAVLATLAAAGIKNYWPTIRKQIEEWKKRSSPKPSAKRKSKSATRKASGRRTMSKPKKSLRKTRK